MGSGSGKWEGKREVLAGKEKCQANLALVQPSTDRGLVTFYCFLNHSILRGGGGGLRCRVWVHTVRYRSIPPPPSKKKRKEELVCQLNQLFIIYFRQVLY
jgi:hypothetical protein